MDELPEDIWFEITRQMMISAALTLSNKRIGKYKENINVLVDIYIAYRNVMEDFIIPFKSICSKSRNSFYKFANSADGKSSIIEEYNYAFWKLNSYFCKKDISVEYVLLDISILFKSGLSFTGFCKYSILFKYKLILESLTFYVSNEINFNIPCIYKYRSTIFTLEEKGPKILLSQSYNIKNENKSQVRRTLDIFAATAEFPLLSANKDKIFAALHFN